MKMIFSHKAVIKFTKQRFFYIILLSVTVSWAASAANNTEPKKMNKQVAAPAMTVKPVISAQTRSQQSAAKTEAKWQLNTEQWELARSGASILSLPVLNSVLESWLTDRQKNIEIRYPGGEDGELWVQELTDWLVSLGIPSKNLVTNAGSGGDDVIKFNIINKQ